MSLNQVSVLITCFNKKDHLKNSLNKISKLLELGSDVVIVDDGSTDGSKEILIDYSKKESRINLISTGNHGSASARNLALTAALREFVLFFDIDDDLNIDVLVKTVKAISLSTCDAIIANYSINGFDTPVDKNLFSKELRKMEFSDSRDSLLQHLGYWRILYRNSFLKFHSLSFHPTFAELNDKYFILDDVFWLLHFYANDGNILLMPENDILYSYHIDTEDTSLSWKKFTKQAKYFPMACRVSYLYAKEHLQDSQITWYKTASYRLMVAHLKYLTFREFLWSIPSIIALIFQFGFYQFGIDFTKDFSAILSKNFRNTLYDFKLKLS